MKLLMRTLSLIIIISSLIGCANKLPIAPLIIQKSSTDTVFSSNNTQKQSIEINLLTLNTWGLPSPIGKKLKERMTRIGKTINNKFDIVCLQETFTRDSRYIGLYSKFAYQHWENNGGTLKIGSGLYNLSKYKINEIKFKEHPRGSGFDKFARKGVLLTRIEIPGLGEVDVYNTHYQSGNGENEAQLRLRDNIVMSDFIKENDKGNLTILTGDYNFTPGSKEYIDLWRKTKFVDSFKLAHPFTDGYTSDSVLNPYVDDKEPRQRLDYIFILPNKKYWFRVSESKVVFKEKIDGYYLSDHFGVNTKIQVRKILSK